MIRYCSYAALILVSVGLGSGCGSSGPARQRLQGEVIFNGQPIPAGTIVFTPDSSQGNKGPQGVAVIKDGKYDTAAAEGRGLGTGPTIIRVTGQGTDQSLWCEYEFKADLTEKQSALKIEVPATAGNQRPPAAI